MGERAAYGMRARPLKSLFGGVVGVGKHAHFRVRLVAVYLGALMPTDEVGRDAVQPGEGLRTGDVVVAALPERGEERLGDDVVGRIPGMAITRKRTTVPGTGQAVRITVVMGEEVQINRT
ncbi:hypothetical protein J2S55_008479 [Streptosporangium brasiliense]|uniref:Uncharacterized protein n=1 Tax=Streptosporangium brasiliense TaxID=47480 RepID=A0ABT9RJF6_9ACTN|nr:hypothetical protein [Streptosporangium brasiliense]MDP9869213.1 hypothetical protein [Streptosporangium brasiliense]